MRRLGLTLVVWLLADPALGACCNVVKTSATPPEIQLRICEMAPTGACQTVLWEGTLAAGASVNVCPENGTIVTAESDGAGGWGEPTGAVCDGGDVEL